MEHAVAQGTRQAAPQDGYVQEDTVQRAPDHATERRQWLWIHVTLEGSTNNEVIAGKEQLLIASMLVCSHSQEQDITTNRIALQEHRY